MISLRRCGPERQSFPSPGQRGMTLMEMLIVLSIIGITAGTALLSIGGSAGADGQAEARRLEARLQLAADESMVSDRAIALALSPNGYGFLAWDEARGAWRPVSAGLLGEPHQIPRGMTLTSGDGQRILPLGTEEAMGQFTVSLNSKGRHWSIVFDGLTARAQPVTDAL